MEAFRHFGIPANEVLTYDQLLPYLDEKSEPDVDMRLPDGSHVTVHWDAIDGDGGFDDPECAATGYAVLGNSPS